MEFYVLKNKNWVINDFKENNIIPYGWCQSDRAIPCSKKIIATFDTEKEAKVVCRALNNEIIKEIA